MISKSGYMLPRTSSIMCPRARSGQPSHVGAREWSVERKLFWDTHCSVVDARAVMEGTHPRVRTITPRGCSSLDRYAACLIVKLKGVELATVGTSSMAWVPGAQCEEYQKNVPYQPVGMVFLMLSVPTVSVSTGYRPSIKERTLGLCRWPPRFRGAVAVDARGLVTTWQATLVNV